jgi:hypothetical protein
METPRWPKVRAYGCRCHRQDEWKVRLEDFVREPVTLVAHELLEGEISAEIGDALGEVAGKSRCRIAAGTGRVGGSRESGRSSR